MHSGNNRTQQQLMKGGREYIGKKAMAGEGMSSLKLQELPGVGRSQMHLQRQGRGEAHTERANDKLKASYPNLVDACGLGVLDATWYA